MIGGVLMIYLDNAASTKPSKAVVNKVNEVMEIYGNPSSLHDMGTQAKNIIIDSKRTLAGKLNCDARELYFTSGATMSNNLFIQGFLLAHPNARLIISSIEHNDIIMLANHLDEVYGKYWVYRLGVDDNGNVSIKELINILSALSKQEIPTLTCIQWANGECGTIQDMKLISDIVHQFPYAYLYSDITQYIPYFPVDLNEILLDGFGMSGQKINCIKGIGLMYVNKEVNIMPIIWGEQGMIGGTENVIGIAALTTALSELNYDNQKLIEKRDLLIQGIQQMGGQIIGTTKNRLPNNVCAYLNKDDGEYIVVMLNEMGVCVSSGSACSSGSGEPSHVVLALGYSPIIANSCIRFTLSKDNTIEEIHEVIDIVNGIITY